MTWQSCGTNACFEVLFENNDVFIRNTCFPFDGTAIGTAAEWDEFAAAIIAGRIRRPEPAPAAPVAAP